MTRNSFQTSPSAVAFGAIFYDLLKPENAKEFERVCVEVESRVWKDFYKVVQRRIAAMTDAQVSAVTEVLRKQPPLADIGAPWSWDTAPGMFPGELFWRIAVFALPLLAIWTAVTFELTTAGSVLLIGPAFYGALVLHAAVRHREQKYEQDVMRRETRNVRAYHLLEAGLKIPRHIWGHTLLGLVEIERRRREVAYAEAQAKAARDKATAAARKFEAAKARRTELVRDFQGRFGMSHPPEARMHPGPYGFSPITGLPLSAPGVEFDGTPVGTIAQRLGVAAATLVPMYGLGMVSSGSNGGITSLGLPGMDLSPMTGIPEAAPGIEYDGTPVGTPSFSDCGGSGFGGCGFD